MTFRIFGVKIYLSFFFVLLISIAVIFDSTGYIIPTILATALHETAHLLAMIIAKCKPRSISIIPAGIIITKQFAMPHRTDAVILFCGPLANLIISAVFINILSEFAAINFILGIFNLLPVRGLDGGELLFRFLCFLFGENRSSIILKLLNIILGIGLIFTGVMLLLHSKINLSFIILGIYILLSVIIKL